MWTQSHGVELRSPEAERSSGDRRARAAGPLCASRRRFQPRGLDVSRSSGRYSPEGMDPAMAILRRCSRIFGRDRGRCGAASTIVVKPAFRRPRIVVTDDFKHGAATNEFMPVSVHLGEQTPRTTSAPTVERRSLHSCKCGTATSSEWPGYSGTHGMAPWINSNLVRHHCRVRDVRNLSRH